MSDIQYHENKKQKSLNIRENNEKAGNQEKIEEKILGIQLLFRHRIKMRNQPK